MWPTVISAVAIIVTVLTLIIGYLIKRAIFGEIDSIRKDLEKMEAGKAGVELCIQTHKALNQTLIDLKRVHEKNGEILQKVQIDVAVVKARLNGDGT